MKYESLKVGATYWDIERRKMGNTALRTVALIPVQILELKPEHRGAIVQYGSLPPRHWGERRLKKLRLKKPETETNALGQVRLKRKIREEGAGHGNQTTFKQEP